MNTAHLAGQHVEIRIESVNTTLSAVILAVESAGVWVHKGDVAEKIATSHGGPRSKALNEPAVFLPFARISWLMTEAMESVYQKAR
jgi:hypothetical protein